MIQMICILPRPFSMVISAYQMLFHHCPRSFPSSPATVGLIATPTGKKNSLEYIHLRFPIIFSHHEQIVLVCWILLVCYSKHYSSYVNSIFLLGTSLTTGFLNILKFTSLRARLVHIPCFHVCH